MSTIIADKFKASDDEIIPVSEMLTYKVIKSYRADYTGGSWNNSTTYNWVPGMYYDYTPMRSDSRIRVYCGIPVAGVNAAHAISHWIFYSNSVEIGRHCVSGNHLEDFSTYMWDTASWGAATQARIGYQMRVHANDNNEVRPFTTRYWNGTGSGQNCKGQFVIEEYISES